MTKKPSEKNKAWERDRRDRLNKAFDELAKLLPKYDPSVAWSKIEIIQKSIAFISDFSKRQCDYLKSKDPEHFSEREQLIDCLRFYQDRNGQLKELLKQSKIALPPVPLPKLLINKPDLLPPPPPPIDNDAICLEKTKAPRRRGKKSDSNPKAGEEKNNKKTESSNGMKQSLPNMPEDSPESDKNSVFMVQTSEACCPDPSESTLNKENQVLSSSPGVIAATAYQTAVHDAALQPSRKQKFDSDPHVPAKPVFLPLYQRKTKGRSRKLLYRKCYPLSSTILHIDAHRNSQPNLLTPSIRKTSRRKKLKKRTKFPKIRQPIKERSISPTAAFLLSFPVVTSSLLNGKNVENVENVDASVNLENLNNFFATEEYSKFCDQAPVAVDKVPTPICTPMHVESIEKPVINDKPMTSFTVSAITRPCSPKKTNIRQMMTNKKGVHEAPVILENKLVSSPTGSFDTCFNTVTTSALSNLTNSFPRFLQSTAKDSIESSAKPAQISVKNLTPATGNWTGVHASSASTSVTSTSSMIHNSVSSKTASKAATSSYYSPTKGFFYDLPSHSQPTAYNNLTPTLFSSTESLNSVTTPTKSHSLPSFPSIKPELLWLASNTTATVSTSTTTTSIASCNLNTHIETMVSEAMSAMNYSFAVTPTKYSEPTFTDSSKKSSSNKCNNHMNLFLPYEDVQYTPTFPSFSKSTESPWKPEKSKDTTDQIFYDCEQSKQKSHVNWMTSPTTDFTPTSASTLPIPATEFGSNQLQPTSTNFDFNFACRKDSYDDDNQFMSWSETKSLNTDFSTAYSYENFGSNEAPPNKTIKQIFSVSQLVDQTPVDTAMKKTTPKTVAQKANPVKQTFSNIYSAESLIAKKDHNHRFYNNEAPNIQADFHNSNNFFYNYPNTQNCTQSENDYLGASAYPASTALTNIKNAPAPSFETTSASTPSTTNYFTHSISSNANDPYDPTYFPSANYNHPTNWNHGHSTMKTTPMNNYNQVYGGMDTASCQQTTNVSGNLTNFNLSSICPEIHGKTASEPTVW